MVRHDPLVSIPPRFATDPALVAGEAAAVAGAWSGDGAPPSWRLVAAQFSALRDDPELAELAACAPPDRLPALLFTAAATFLVLTDEPEPLREWFPRAGVPPRPLAPDFASEYRAFCLQHRERLRELMAAHRYQMSEVGRCAGLVLALDPALRDGREVAFVDIGCGAGLALQFDRYRYRFTGPGEAARELSAPASAPVMIETALRGDVSPVIPDRLPNVVQRIGVDIEPLDLTDPAVRTWLAACVPQTLEAVSRFAEAASVALSEPSSMVRADACCAVGDVLAAIPAGRFVCVQDSYVSVFFTDDERRQFRAEIDAAGASRDLDWISIDPLVPLGADARDTVLGDRAPEALIARARRDGVFGVITRRSYREGRHETALLGLAHPGAAWHEWCPQWRRSAV